jgi:hypothetical protein
MAPAWGKGYWIVTRSRIGCYTWPENRIFSVFREFFKKQNAAHIDTLPEMNAQPLST